MSYRSFVYFHFGRGDGKEGGVILDVNVILCHVYVTRRDETRRDIGMGTEMGR